jgi:hypothetical protein
MFLNTSYIADHLFLTGNLVVIFALAFGVLTKTTVLEYQKASHFPNNMILFEGWLRYRPKIQMPTLATRCRHLTPQNVTNPIKTLPTTTCVNYTLRALPNYHHDHFRHEEHAVQRVLEWKVPPGGGHGESKGVPVVIKAGFRCWWI